MPNGRPIPHLPKYKRWYKTARWQKLRWSVLVDALFQCALCNRIEHDTSKLVADHIKPHKGDEALFWDRDNLQCLCKRCHDSDKQSQERGSSAPWPVDNEGWPIWK